ncbi:MAG: hypothetical protein NVS2B16_30100 [Chloroflexota bacterium]
MGSEEHHEESIDPAERWTSDLSLEHDELLAQKCVFSDQLRLPLDRVDDDTANEPRVRGTGPGNKSSLDPMARGSNEPVNIVCETNQHRGNVLR